MKVKTLAGFQFNILSEAISSPLNFQFALTHFIQYDETCYPVICVILA